MRNRNLLIYATLIVVVLALTAFPAAASVRTIDSGSDFWVTPGDGSTFAQFKHDPLPADFFCSGSSPFAGTIIMQGVPVVDSPVEKLGLADTAIQRLDQAVFDDKGVAVTRIQVRAMQFEGTRHLVNECGTFRVNLELVGEQPVTQMRIFRTSPEGGRFEAEIAVNIKIAFTPVDHKAEVVSVTRELRFPSYQGGLWASKPGKNGVEHRGFVRLDTDYDGRGDTFVPGTSPGFAAGWAAKAEGLEAFKPEASTKVDDPAAGVTLPELCPINCHCESEGVHCPQPLVTASTE